MLIIKYWHIYNSAKKEKSKPKNNCSSVAHPGAIHFLFECTNDFNEYMMWGDYVRDFNDFKSLWYRRLPIVLNDFSKLHTIRIIFIRFQYDFTRFQILFVKIRNRRLNSRLTRFYVIPYDCILDFKRSGSMISLVNGPL